MTKCQRSRPHLRVGFLVLGVMAVLDVGVVGVADFVQQLDGEGATQRLRYERVLDETGSEYVMSASGAM